MPTFNKDPEAVLDYSFDWTAWLAPGETIVSYVLTIPGGITKTSDGEAGGVVTFWLSGGLANTRYRIECLIVTSDDRADERSISIKVVDR